MGRDLRAGRGGGQNNAGGQNNGGGNGLSEQDIARLSALPEKDLMSQLFSSVSKGKQNGTLSDKDLEAFVAQMSPMLSPEQRARLQSLVSMLKG